MMRCLLFCSAILCLLLFTPLIQAQEFEDVMSARDARYLWPQSNITYEDYLIKLYSTGEDSATLIIYRHHRFQRLFDLYLNEARDYDDFTLKLLEIRDHTPLIALYQQEKRRVWKKIDTRVLRWAQPLHINEYTIKPVAFQENIITLNITHNNTTREDTYQAGDEKSYDERLKIHITSIDPQGTAQADFYRAITPLLNATLTTDKSEYTPDDTILLSIHIPPQPSTCLITAHITTNPNTSITPPLLSTTQVSNATTLQVQISDLPIAQELRIGVELTGYDCFGRSYTQTIEKKIHIPPTIVVKKTVSPVEVDTTRPVNITLSLYNSADTSVNITIKDPLPESITPVTRLPESITLEAKNTTYLNYTVLPTTSGVFELEAAQVIWGENTIHSNKATLTVHGPRLEVKKKLISVKQNTATIEIELANTGDRDADVVLRDQLPLDAELLTGGTIWADLLPAGETATMRYTIRFAEDRISPPAKAEYSDLRGTRKHVESNLLRIKTKTTHTAQSLTLEPEKTLVSLTIILTLLSATIGSVFAALYLLIRWRHQH